MRLPTPTDVLRGGRRSPGSEPDVSQAWHLTHPALDECLVRIECSAARALKLHGQFRAEGFAVRVVTQEEADEIDDRMDAREDA